jgi:hypothetical protein
VRIQTTDSSRGRSAAESTSVDIGISSLPRGPPVLLLEVTLILGVNVNTNICIHERTSQTAAGPNKPMRRRGPTTGPQPM